MKIGTPTTGLPQVVETYKALVEAELQAVLAPRTVGLYQMLRYQFGWLDPDGRPTSASAGKRLRPALCLATCQALGGDVRQAVPAAAAVELVHNFSLVHDDIEDNSQKRCDRPAVWKVWGAAQAINVGDSLHALSRLALQRMLEAGVSADRVLWATRLLDEATLHLCEGQSLDIMYQETVDVGIEDYYTMARGKTAALIACAMQLGGIVATGDAGIVDTLGDVGTGLGTAFQIHDDVLDMTGEDETLAGDIQDKKKTYPVVYALEKGMPRAKEELRRIYGQEKLSQKDVERVVSILRETQSIRFAREASRTSYEEAIAAYERLPIGNDLKAVQQIARFMVERDR